MLVVDLARTFQCKQRRRRHPLPMTRRPQVVEWSADLPHAIVCTMAGLTWLVIHLVPCMSAVCVHAARTQVKSGPQQREA